MKFRIDFGRVLPGLLLFFAGLFILAVLVLFAVVAFLFSFMPAAQSALGFILQLMLVPSLMMAGGVILGLTGVSWWGTGWFNGVAKARALKDRIRYSERIGEVFGVAVTFIIFLFLYENQLRGVAFFTSEFGAQAQFFFYAPLFTGMVLSLARAVYGHRNGVRPFDSLNALFLAASAFWLLQVFPFDFAHLGDMFPSVIQFLFGWVTNDIGRLLFIVAGLASLMNFVYTLVLYSSVRGQLIAMRAGSFN